MIDSKKKVEIPPFVLLSTTMVFLNEFEQIFAIYLSEDIWNSITYRGRSDVKNRLLGRVLSLVIVLA